MLHVLTITDYALIDHLELAFAPGLNVLTGETGAGKSIIVDAIGLLLGKRAEEGLIRAEASQARVQGLFALTSAEADAARDILEEAGLPTDDAEEIVVVRELNHQGRNVCRVNGAIVPLRVLTALGERLVDIHGQGQQLPLLNVRTQLAILDRFAGLEPLAAEVADAVGRLRAARQELAALRTDERELARRADLLRFQAEEIAAASLQPGEDAQLEAERTVAANAERLQALAAQAYDALYEGDDRAAAVDSLSAAAQAVAGLAQVDDSASSLREDAESLVIQAQELARSLQSYRDGVDVDPGRLQEIEDRLETVRQLKRKYGATIEEVLRFGEEAAAELDGIAHSGERAEALEAEETGAAGAHRRASGGPFPAASRGVRAAERGGAERTGRPRHGVDDVPRRRDAAARGRRRARVVAGRRRGHIRLRRHGHRPGGVPPLAGPRRAAEVTRSDGLRRRDLAAHAGRQGRPRR